MSKRLWHEPTANGFSDADSEDVAEQMTLPPTQTEARPATDMDKASLVVRQIDRWIASMERLRLADYVRYVDNRKRMFWTSFWCGVAKGVGMAVGFTILGALLVLFLQNLATHNLPLIGDVLAQIMSVVQNQMK